MCRIRRVPSALDHFVRTLHPHGRWDHWTDFRLLVLAMSVMWGRRHVAHVYRDLEAPDHRTRCNNFFLGARWDLEAALRQKAHERLQGLGLQPGTTVDLVIDDAKTATRGQGMDAVAQMKYAVSDTSIHGHPDVCAILMGRDHVIPYG